MVLRSRTVEILLCREIEQRLARENKLVTLTAMVSGNLRIRYWALDATGARVEELASAQLQTDGTYESVFTYDPRAIDAVLELRDGAHWREVRSRYLEAGLPRVLPQP